jgi:hypothetical protein
MGELGLLPEVGLGALTRWCGPELVDRVVDKCGRREHWVRLLPARTMVYFELARCLFPGEGYAHVYEHLLPLPVDAVPVREAPGFRIPNKSSLCKARAKLGPEVMEALFREVAGPLADQQEDASAFWRGLRVLSFDGAVLTVADSPANAAAFGRSGPEDRRSAYPQARIVPLIECGTRALVDAAVGGWQQSEAVLALQLAPSVGPGMLVLADAGFAGVVLWDAFRARGAHLVWRLCGPTAAHVDRELEDGSYLARMHLAKDTRSVLRNPAADPPGQVQMRVIEYRVDGEPELFRLGTTLTDPRQAPASEVAALYQQRWNSEGQLAETKTAQLGERAVLLSRTPAGVLQEIWAQLTLHQLTHRLMHHAATRPGPPLDLDRISFRHTQLLTRLDLRPGLSPL